MRMGTRFASKFSVLAGLCMALPTPGQTAPGQTAPQSPNRPAVQMPAPTPNDTLKSVEVMADHQVRFRLWAPNVTEVKLHAEGPEATPGITPQEANKYQAGMAMVKGDQGIWEASIGPIEPGTYRYTFTVDGVSTTDPRNPLTSQSLTHSSSLYEVPGADFIEYKAGMPHGAISTVYYDSSATGGQRRMHVYTPPGYENGTARLPVLYLLHGGGDSDDSWGTVGRAGGSVLIWILALASVIVFGTPTFSPAQEALNRNVPLSGVQGPSDQELRSVSKGRPVRLSENVFVFNRSIDMKKVGSVLGVIVNQVVLVDEHYLCRTRLCVGPKSIWELQGQGRIVHREFLNRLYPGIPFGNNVKSARGAVIRNVNHYGVEVLVRPNVDFIVWNRDRDFRWFSILHHLNLGIGGFCAFPRGFSRSQSYNGLSIHQIGLPLDLSQCQPSNHCIHYRDVYDDPFRSCKPWQRLFWGCILTIGGFWLAAVRAGERWVNNNMRWCDWPLGLVGLVTCCMGATTLIFGHAWPPKQECSESSDNRQPFQHNAAIVPRKPIDKLIFTGYSNRRGLVMANVLNMDKQIMVVSALAEGSSIRSIERMSGVHRDTIMRLGVKVGQGCTSLMDAKMRGLSCNRLEMDEIWGFVGKKERHVHEGESGVGSIWTFCVIDAQTKLVPTFKVGERDSATANAFLADVASRVAGRVQISTDGLAAYKEAIEKSFGADADYGQIIKTYGHAELTNNRRYSAPEFVSSEKKVIAGSPDYDLISTSYVERLNATTRLHMRRLTRLTLAFSKKRENFEAAVGLHFGYYNFVKRHSTLRCTPAMAANVTNTFWSVGDLVEAAV
jgi:IS1 family transposase